MKHIKYLLLGLIVIALVIVILYGIVWLCINTSFLYVLGAIVAILLLLILAYIFGGAIIETRQANKE